MDDMLVSGRWHLGDVRVADGSEPRLNAGIRFVPDNHAKSSLDAGIGHVCHENPLLTVEVTHPGRPLDFCVTAFNTPIAQDRLASVIADVAGPDLQCLPVLVGNETRLSVLNAVRVVRCIDDDRSTFIKFTERDLRPDLLGQYLSVTKLRLNTRLIPEDAHFFRLKDWEVGLIVSEQVKIAMERAGCLGARFEEVTGASELS